MEQIVVQIISQYGLTGLAVAVFIVLWYRQGQQNLERNKAVERRFDEERERAAGMETRLLNEFERANTEKDREISSLTERLDDSVKHAKETETAHLSLQREFDQFRGQSEALSAQTLRELDQTKTLYEEERRAAIGLSVTNNRLTADNQRLIKRNNQLVEEKEVLEEKLTELRMNLEASKVEIDALKANSLIVMEAENHGPDS